MPSKFAGHTAAPWRNEGPKTIRAGKHTTNLISDGRGMIVAESDVEADAALISAAPDLLAACEGMREALHYAEIYFDANSDHDEAANGLSKVRRAIAMADRVLGK